MEEIKFQAETVFKIMELWSQEIERDKAYYLSRRKNNPESKQSQIEEYLKPLKERAELQGIDFDYFWYDFHVLYLRKAFENLKRAEEFMNEYKAIGIEPYFLFDIMFEEVKKRDAAINGTFIKEKFTPTQEEIKDYLINLEKNNFPSFVFDPLSKDQYLRRLHSEKVNSIQEMEKKAVNEFGYHVKGFFQAGKFNASQEGLNNFFFTAYLKIGNEFFTVFTFLQAYFKAYKEALILMKIISGEIGSPEQKQTISKALEFLKKPNSSRRIDPLTVSEFETVVNWVNTYFEIGYEIPKEITPFKKLPSNLGNIRYGFKYLWFNLKSPQPLPESLPELIGAIFPKAETDLETLQKLPKPNNF